MNKIKLTLDNLNDVGYGDTILYDGVVGTAEYDYKVGMVVLCGTKSLTLVYVVRNYCEVYLVER